MKITAIKCLMQKKMKKIKIYKKIPNNRTNKSVHKKTHRFI